MRFLKIFLGIGVAIQMFLGCQLFESNKVTPQEIKSASTWSEKDQEPSFSDCDGFDQAIDKKNCFESMISNSIMDYISENPWESSQYIDEEIVLNLHIDKAWFWSSFHSTIYLFLLFPSSCIRRIWELKEGT